MIFGTCHVTSWWRSVYEVFVLFCCRIAYPTVKVATHASKCVFLHTLQDDGKTVILGFRLVSQKAANGLYRYVA